MMNRLMDWFVILLVFSFPLWLMASALAYAKLVYGDYRCAFAECRIEVSK